MLPPVYEVLRDDAAVTAILGNPPSVYSHGEAKAGASGPYVVWSVVGTDPQNHLSGAPGMDMVSLQLDCYSASGQQVKSLAVAVRDAMERVCTFTGVAVDQRETETRLYRIALQFDYWLAR